MENDAEASGEAEPAEAGRPTKYKKEYAELAEKFCLLGATNEKLAEFFDVCGSTIDNWLVVHPEFLGAVKRGRAVADANVVNSLYNRALGYSHPEEKLMAVSQGQNMGAVVERHDTIKHYPPDPTSAIFWLKNRQPELWRDKKELQVDGEPTTAIHFDVVENDSQPEDNESTE